MLIAMIALVGICLAAGLLMNRRTERSGTALNALYGAQKAYETELKTAAGVKTSKPPAIDEKADPKAREAAEKALRAEEEIHGKRMDELAFSKLDVDAKFPEAVKKYRAVIADFDGTRAAQEARMGLGTLYFNHGEPAKAATLFQAAVSSASGNAEKAMAYQSWGYALENDGKASEALTAFDKAGGYAEGAVKGDALLSVARNYEAMHDAAKARSTYDQILSQLPNTDAAKTAEALKAKL
jgi:tetratricopeptide (TPR) repeat protein